VAKANSAIIELLLEKGGRDQVRSAAGGCMARPAVVELLLENEAVNSPGGHYRHCARGSPPATRTGVTGGDLPILLRSAYYIATYLLNLWQ
jgi:hypothetical protein